ncbi:MAG: hypothetical protein HY875_03700 [Chloroflexi bacterium]|nr:hypothetical protein [Chloroflexota bacterium]
MSEVLDILTLQGFDDEAAALHAALADVEQRLLGDPELVEARRVLGEAEAALKAVRADQRRLEDEVERLSDKIAPEEKRLYDGSVRNPKELSSIQHELQALTAQRGRFEDQLLEVLSKLEAATNARQAAAAKVQELEANWAKQSQQLRHDALRLNDAIARADLKREAQKAKISPRSFQMYEDLRRRKGGLAVARMQGGACTGCRVSLPDAVRRKAFSPVFVVQCPNCERILAAG